jgi:hypothetical protein
MSFYIEVSSPAILYCPSEVAIDVADAIETIFPTHEDGFVVWDGVRIPFSYKYDLSVMYDDIPFCMTKIRESEAGNYNLCFGSNTFCVVWNLEWKDRVISITSQWIGLRGEIANEINNTCRYLECEVDIFIGEFKKLLQFINKNIEISSIVIDDKDSFQELTNTIISI